MLSENEIFANLERALQEADEPTQKPTTITRATPDRLAIDPQFVTMMTFNYFDNGPDRKVTWTNARCVMNIQIFGETEPFTPSSDLVTHDFSVQLHTIEFFSRYLADRHSKQCEAYRDLINDTFSKTDVYPDMLIGQPFSKRHGTSYAWGTILRTWTDDLGEFAAELLIDGTSFRDQGFSKPPTRKNGKRAPDLISKHDPHGLWVKKSPKFPRKTS